MLDNEISLLDLYLAGLGNCVNIGEKIYDHLNSKIIKCSTVLNNIQTPNVENDEIENLKYQKWYDYLNFFNNNKYINKEKINTINFKSILILEIMKLIKIMKKVY